MNAKFELDTKKVWVPGSHGMVASALVRCLQQENVTLLETSREEVDLTDSQQVKNFYATQRPDVVLLAAAKVGGIYANDHYPADFIGQNTIIQYNVIHYAAKYGIKKLLFLGSSCIYPKECPQPMKEEYLLTGPLETTNQWYAIAKITGIKMCQAYRKQLGCDFISALPTNLYGPNDNFHPENSHVPAALLSRFHTAKIDGSSAVHVWGSGKPLREFMHVDDLADACIYLIKNYSASESVNIGTGEEISIANFAELIKQTTRFSGNIIFDTNRPDGTLRKRLDVEKLLTLGWRYKIELVDGIAQYYDWYLNEVYCEQN
ncbi:MAG: GDP-L-fucose synthase [Pseudomonadota bacterium]